jgi:hypothetical protein
MLAMSPPCADPRRLTRADSVANAQFRLLFIRESTLSGHRFLAGGGCGSVVSRTLVPDGTRFGGLGFFWKL